MSTSTGHDADQPPLAATHHPTCATAYVRGTLGLPAEQPVDADPDTAIARQRGRARQVPAAVIAKLAANLEVPDGTEAHVVQWVG